MAPCCHLAVTGRKMKLTEEGEGNRMWSSYQGTVLMPYMDALT